MSARENPEWTPQVDEALLRLASAGLDFNAITIRLNDAFGTSFSRNAVIGRFHRKFGPKTTRKRKIRTTAPAAREAAALPTPPKCTPAQPRKISHEQAATDPVTLDARSPAQCCWPVNEGGPYLFCGAPRRWPRHAGDTRFLSYCETHFAMLLDKPRRFARAGRAA